MHCPRCGSDALTGQQFCRSCGFNLDKVAELVAEQPAVLDTRLAHVHQRQRRMEHWAGVAGLATMILVGLTLIYLVITEMIIKSGQIGAGLLLLVLIIGGGLMGALQGYSKSLKQRLTRQALEDLPPPSATRQLEPHRDPAQSVTERTTELLPVSRNANTKEV